MQCNPAALYTYNSMHDAVLGRAGQGQSRAGTAGQSRAKQGGYKGDSARAAAN
jgi:hypothetical protein